MLIELMGFFYGLSVLIAMVCFVWGIGSALMNGVAGSALGPCLFTAMVFVGLSMFCAQWVTP